MKAVVSEITLQELEAVAVKLTKKHVHDHLLPLNVIYSIYTYGTEVAVELILSVVLFNWLYACGIRCSNRRERNNIPSYRLQ